MFKSVLALFKSPRFWGLSGTALGFYLLFFVVLAKVDVGWIFPTRELAEAVIEVWPRLPFFTVEKTTLADGREETYYTVPTRQFTKQEIARMFPATNAMARPAPPK